MTIERMKTLNDEYASLQYLKIWLKQRLKDCDKKQDEIREELKKMIS